MEAKVFNTNATKEIEVICRVTKLGNKFQNNHLPSSFYENVGNKLQNNNLPSSFYENDKNVETTGLSKIKLLKIRKK